MTDMPNERPGARAADALEDSTSDVVDQASEQSFPASDPPAWTLGLTAPDSFVTKGIEDPDSHRRGASHVSSPLRQIEAGRMDWSETGGSSAGSHWKGYGLGNVRGRR